MVKQDECNEKEGFPFKRNHVKKAWQIHAIKSGNIYKIFHIGDDRTESDSYKYLND